MSLEGDKKCPICHKLFHYKRASYNPAPKTCSKKCRYKSASITGTHHILLKCIICKKDFHLPPSLVGKRGKGDGSYCSKECRWKTRMRWTENEKQNARSLVRNLVKRGIILPKLCEKNGCDNGSEPHHYMGYDRVNWLDIKWLCRLHHVREHEHMRREKIVTNL